MNQQGYLNKKMLPTQALEKACRIILYILVTTLIFEGIIRKFVPGAVSLAIFFLKDVICFIALFFIYNKYSVLGAFAIKEKWMWVIFAFIPLLIYTAILDPILALFAAKQYLLYPVVVLLFQYGFFNGSFTKLQNFLFYYSFLLLPTTAIAVLQNSLPPTHWLNLSVGGNSLEAFAAAGYLRVSSTFSFTGQYSWYLNASCPIIISYIAIATYQTKKSNFLNWLFWLSLAIAYIIAIFITGGRTAVLGAGATIVGGLFCLLIRRPKWVLGKGFFFIILGIFFLGVLKGYKPQYFAAYDARSAGSESETHEEEIQKRVVNGLTGWTVWFWDQPLQNIIMGNGLGVMSNGSDQVSNYAKSMRQKWFWTEADTPTIFWEGGIYLAIVWYLFRLFVIVLCFNIFIFLKQKELIFAGAFLFGYIAVTGIIGTLGMQPPIAIWWWLTVGILLSLKYTELAFLQKQKEAASLQNRKENNISSGSSLSYLKRYS